MSASPAHPFRSFASTLSIFISRYRFWGLYVTGILSDLNFSVFAPLREQAFNRLTLAVDVLGALVYSTHSTMDLWESSGSCPTPKAQPTRNRSGKRTAGIQDRGEHVLFLDGLTSTLERPGTNDRLGRLGTEGAQALRLPDRGAMNTNYRWYSSPFFVLVISNPAITMALKFLTA